MWASVFFFLFATAANYGVHGWKTGHIYKYDYKCCVYAITQGVMINEFMKGDIYIQPVSSDKLSVSIQNFWLRSDNIAKEKDQINTFPSNDLNFESRPFRKNPFEINLQTGLIKNLNVTLGTSNRDLVPIKVIVDHLQFDLRGENCNESKPCQLPTKSKTNSVYKTTENSNGGMCETQYNVTLLPDGISQNKSDKNGPFYLISKAADFKKCQQTLTQQPMDNVYLYGNNKRIIISEENEKYTIHLVNSQFVKVTLTENASVPKDKYVLFSNLTLISVEAAKSSPQTILKHEVINATYFDVGF